MVAFTHRACGADNCPYGQAAAEWDEGLFAKAPPYLVEAVFVVEVTVMIMLAWLNLALFLDVSREGIREGKAYLFSSKEEGSGALFGEVMMVVRRCGGVAWISMRGGAIFSSHEEEKGTIALTRYTFTALQSSCAYMTGCVRASELNPLASSALQS